MQRTIRLKLRPTDAQVALLAETTHQVTLAFNHICTHGWQHHLANSTKLHRATYYGLRSHLPNLPSNLLVQARMKAAEAVRSALTHQRKGRRSTQPHSAACPPRYNQRTLTFDWARCRVSLATVSGRQIIPFAIAAYAAKYIGGTPATADLIYRDGRWWLHVAVTLPDPAIPPTDQVVGVDLGLKQPAVTSNNRFLGQKAWRAIEGRYFKHIRALQQKGTRRARWRLRKLRHRRAHFRRDCDHVLAKQIVQAADPGATIVVENLKHIRRRIKAKRRTATRRRLHNWSFAQLQRFVSYKAAERGCTVVAVDPRHTSQMCACCGHIARNNRRSRALFICRQCGFTLHADLNAARVIAARYHAHGGISIVSGLSVNQPHVSSPAHPGADTNCSYFCDSS